MDILSGGHDTELGKKIAHWYSTQMKCAAPLAPYSAICWFRGTNPVACAIFNGYNGSAVHLHFYGPGHVNRTVIRTIARYVFEQLKCNVVVATVRRNHAFKYLLPRTGFKYVAVIPSYFGQNKSDDGIIYYFHRSSLDKWIKTDGQHS